MTTLDDLRALVGAERFAEAEWWAWETAANTGKKPSSDETNEWPEGAASVPHDLADAIWFDERLSPLEIVDLHFTLYRVMPCYANFMYVDLGALDSEAIGVFWRQVRELLNDEDDRLAEPVAYWLWCGPFEDSSESSEAWDRTISGEGVGEHGLMRALAAAGPVQWQVKAPLLRRLLRDPAWHGAIFQCIEASVFDVFGHVDVVEANAKLKLTGDAADAAPRVREELAARRDSP